MINPYSAFQSTSTDDDASRTESPKTTSIGLAAALGCVFACVASASSVWFAFQRVYNTVDPVYETMSLATTVVVAFIVSVLGIYSRFVQRVRGHRLAIISAVIALLALMLAFWFAFYIV